MDPEGRGAVLANSGELTGQKVYHVGQEERPQNLWITCVSQSPRECRPACAHSVLV